MSVTLWMGLPTVMTDTPWQLVKANNKKKLASTKSNVTGFVAAKGTVSVITGLSNKHKSDDNDTEQVNKKIKMSEEKNNGLGGHGPQGLIWDGQNYSCAYD